MTTPTTTKTVKTRKPRAKRSHTHITDPPPNKFEAGAIFKDRGGTLYKLINMVYGTGSDPQWQIERTHDGTRRTISQSFIDSHSTRVK